MNVLKTDQILWKEYVNNNEKVIQSISNVIEINNNFYSTPPFDLESGYGYRIFVFKTLKDFVNCMIDNQLFGRVVEFVDLVDEEEHWLSLTYLLSSDIGIVLYIQF